MDLREEKGREARRGGGEAVRRVEERQCDPIGERRRGRWQVGRGGWRGVEEVKRDKREEGLGIIEGIEGG